MLNVLYNRKTISRRVALQELGRLYMDRTPWAAYRRAGRENVNDRLCVGSTFSSLCGHIGSYEKNSQGLARLL